MGVFGFSGVMQSIFWLGVNSFVFLAFCLVALIGLFRRLSPCIFEALLQFFLLILYIYIYIYIYISIIFGKINQLFH